MQKSVAVEYDTIIDTDRWHQFWVSANRDTTPNDNNSGSDDTPEGKKKRRIRRLEEELARTISSEAGTNLEAVCVYSFVVPLSLHLLI